MPAYCVQDGGQQDAEEFFSVYLSALDDELLALLTPISTHKPASAAANVEELREGSHSVESQTEVGKRDDRVRQSSRCVLVVADVCTDTK
jgi:hypothetical protein